MKSEENTPNISLSVNLNSKAHKVNNRPINMCGEHDITFIDHNDKTDFVRGSYDGKIDLNKPGTKRLAKNVRELLLL